MFLSNLDILGLTLESKYELFSFQYYDWAGNNVDVVQFYQVTFLEDFGSIQKGDQWETVSVYFDTNPRVECWVGEEVRLVQNFKCVPTVVPTGE